jgi:flagellar biosynthesis/type III secretory pathway M-ring protein FliF/YscJ
MNTDEMKQIEELAKAIGFDIKRGDLFSVQNIAFEVHSPDVPVPTGKMQRMLQLAERWTGLLRYAALLILFGVVYWLVLRPVKNRVVAMLQMSSPGLLAATAGASGKARVDSTSGMDVLSVTGENAPTQEVQQAVALKKQLITQVKDDPEGASRLIQNWLRQPGEGR